MKNLIFIFLLLPFIASAQDKLEGAWGLKFGSSKEAVIKAVKKRTGLVPDITATDTIFYFNARFGAEKATMIRIQFDEDQMFELLAAFTPESNTNILYDYQRIKSNIIVKYFEPQSDVEKYESPYEKGDGNEATAVKLGYATIGAIWEFPAAGPATSKDGGSVLLCVDKNMKIILAYQDGEISKRVKRRLKERSMSDY